MKVGDKVKLIYDARPLKSEVDYGEGVVTKITPKGWLRIKGQTAGTKRNEIFHPVTGFARGYNTLRFEPIEKIKMPCFECGKLKEVDVDSNEAKGVFNVFCKDSDCEDKYASKL